MNVRHQGLSKLVVEMVGAVQLLTERNLRDNDNLQERNETLQSLEALASQLREQVGHDAVLLEQLKAQLHAALASEQAAIAAKEAAQAQQRAAEAEMHMWKYRYRVLDSELGEVEKLGVQQQNHLVDLHYRLLDKELAASLPDRDQACPGCGEELICSSCGCRVATK